MTTIAAIATAAGRGGIGVIRLSGKRAISIAVNMSHGLTEIIPRHAHYCNWLDADGTVIDSGILLGFPAPNSYTGEDVIEIQAHGSPVVLGALLNRVFELGARPAEPGEFTRKAVENGRLDLSQAEAVIAIIDAATVRASKQAQRHLQGEFGNRIQQVMQELTGAIAHVEACLDFPEEEVPELLFDRVRENIVTGVIDPINQWLASAGFGERLFDGATVAIIGAPNVGKSSLLNHMAGRERAIVSDIAGTTRDLLEIDFEVDGIPVRLVDTAGIRDSSDQIEREGVRRAELAADEADVVLFVADATRPETWQLEEAHSHHRIDLKLMNKSDLSQGEQQDGFLHVSAKSGEGMEALHRELSRYLGSIDIEDEGVMVTHARHREALVETLAKVDRGLQMLGYEAELDLVALEWRTAWCSLGKIVGVGDVEAILDRIFSEFCIGK